ncbi:MAG: alpha/beta hydrolase [Bacteroidaceae bacterium]|nr:alpha/beta hydrolase [Bacteroidaceae bacterium]
MKRPLFAALAACTIMTVQAQYVNKPIDLWPKDTPDAKEAKAAPVTQMGKDKVLRFDKVTCPTLEIFEPTAEAKNGKAVIVCPGGAYNILAYDKEGQEVAKWLAGQGYTAYVLAYRVPKNRLGALQDAQRAIRTVRHRGFQKVGIIGFSAGASLSCRAATLWHAPAYEPQDEIDRLSCRPDFGMLIYPAYLDEGPEHTLTPELLVSSETPPLFVFGTEDDKSYSGPSSLTIADAMQRAGAPIELHYLTKGGHGYGMRTGAGLIWPPLAEQWLKTLK